MNIFYHGVYGIFEIRFFAPVPMREKRREEGFWLLADEWQTKLGL